MANTKASKKDIRRIAKRTEANRQVRSRLKTLQKKTSAAGEGEDSAAATKTAREFMSALDKAAKTNRIHKNKASRLKSKIAKTALAKV